MYFRRYRNPMYARQRRHRSAGIFVFAVTVFGLCAAASWFLGKLSTQIAVSDATDIVTKAVNDSINELIPWGTESATTVTEVIVADTVIVGKVPNTYLNMEN